MIHAPRPRITKITQKIKNYTTHPPKGEKNKRIALARQPGWGHDTANLMHLNNDFFEPIIT
jgi:hypothetical protein